MSAGEIAKLWGLGEIQIGDAVGEPAHRAPPVPPPTLETVVVPARPGGRGAVRVALAQLAEQDPLIDVRQDDVRQELSVSLYGEVQKEVIQATLAGDYGLDVTFRETTPICIERPLGTGEAVEILQCRDEPVPRHDRAARRAAPDGSGIEFRLEVDGRTVPLYVYKTVESFTGHMSEYVRRQLRRGPLGWQVTDCVVTMTECTYSIPDGPPSTTGALSTAADFQAHADRRHACARGGGNGGLRADPPGQPRGPTDTIGAVLPELSRLGAASRRRRPGGGFDDRGDLARNASPRAPTAPSRD